jgi:predicted PolB exonuclease-like 3'-5' exonuclease
MEKMEKIKAEGKEAYNKWRLGANRGYKRIGKEIIKRYNLTSGDLEDMRKLRWNSYMRLYNKRKKIEKIKK